MKFVSVCPGSGERMNDPFYITADEVRENNLIVRLNRSTRVACELAMLLKRDGTLYKKISPRTMRWIKKHDVLHALKEKERDKVLQQQKIRVKALAKLSAKEKEVLGLPDNTATDDE